MMTNNDLHNQCVQAISGSRLKSLTLTLWEEKYETDVPSLHHPNSRW